MKIRSRIAAGAAAVMMLGGLAATASPAFAAQSAPAREVFHTLNLASGAEGMVIGGSSHINNGPAPVAFNAAHNLQWQSIGTTSVYGPDGTKTNGKIFALDQAGKCLGGPGTILLVDCSTGTATVMADVPKTGADTFENRLYTQNENLGVFVASDNVAGNQLTFQNANADFFERWTPSSQGIPGNVATTAKVVSAKRSPLSVNYQELNGHGYGLGAPNGGTGNMIVQVNGDGPTYTFSNDTTYAGDPAGTLKLGNGNFVASNASCSGLTIKSSSSSDGTVWGDHVTSSGAHQLNNRFCSQNGGQGDEIVAYADNTLGNQWKLCDNGPINVDCGTGKFWNLHRSAVG